MRVMKFETYAYALGYFVERPTVSHVVGHPDGDGTWACILYTGEFVMEEDG